MFLLLGLFAIIGLVFIVSPQTAAASPLANVIFDCTPVTSVPFAECDAVADLYELTFGDTWTLQTNWFVIEDPCVWYGITCSGGHVTEIDLASNNLGGTLPASLGNLPNLGQLNLGHNLITGAIPPELGDLASIWNLILTDNLFSDFIPSELANATTLSILDLSYTFLEGPPYRLVLQT